MELPRYLHELMTREGVDNGATLAGLVGVSRAAVSAWLRGETAPGPIARCAMIDLWGLDEAEAATLRRLCDEAVARRGSTC